MHGQRHIKLKLQFTFLPKFPCQKPTKQILKIVRAKAKALSGSRTKNRHSESLSMCRTI